MIMNKYSAIMLTEEGIQDKRYTCNKLGRTYAPLFCNVQIGKPSSFNNAVLACKRHQTKQMLGVYCG